MQFNFRGIYDGTITYAVKDVVSYKPTTNDPIKFYMCLQPNSSVSAKVPNPSGDNEYWGMITTLSNFPTSIDNFITRVNIQANDKTDISRITELTLKTTLTTSEQDELTALISKHRNKLLLPEDLNGIQDSITNLQLFFKSGVESYINSSITSIQSAKDAALISIEAKKNNVITYLDGTTAGQLRNDIGDLTELTTTDKTSLTKALNEVKKGELTFIPSGTNALTLGSGKYYGSGLANAPAGLSSYFTIEVKKSPDGRYGTLKASLSDSNRFWEQTVYYNSSLSTIIYSGWVELARVIAITWTNLTLQNGATGVTGRIPRYTIDGKRVTIEGEILTIANGTVIATLPAGFRPPSTRSFKTSLNYSTTNDGATVTVNTDGTVVVQVTANATNTISLMGVSFYVD